MHIVVSGLAFPLPASRLRASASWSQVWAICSSCALWAGDANRAIARHSAACCSYAEIFLNGAFQQKRTRRTQGAWGVRVRQVFCSTGTNLSNTDPFPVVREILARACRLLEPPAGRKSLPALAARRGALRIEILNCPLPNLGGSEPETFTTSHCRPHATWIVPLWPQNPIHAKSFRPAFFARVSWFGDLASGHVAHH